MSKIVLWCSVQAICRLLDSWQVQAVDFLLVSGTLFIPNVFIVLDTDPNLDKYLNTVLIFSLTVFIIELALNIYSRKQQQWLLYFVDLLSTLTILLDITWIATKIGLNSVVDDNDEKSLNIWKLICLLRLLRLLRTVSMLNYITRRVLVLKRPIDGAQQQPVMACNIGNNVVNALVSQFTGMIIVLAVLAKFLCGWTYNHSPYHAFMACLYNALRSEGGVDSNGLLNIVLNAVQLFTDTLQTKDRPMYLEMGGSNYYWRNSSNEAVRSWSVAEFTLLPWQEGGTESDANLFIDTSKRNSHDAVVEILITLLLMMQMVTFSFSVNLILYFVRLGRFYRDGQAFFSS